MGTITVIVTAYNQGRFLTKSLKSVFSQTRKPSEVVVVDDGSFDNTFEILANFKKKLADQNKKKIKYIRHQKNLGPLSTFNNGLNVARGDYLIFLPADDWFAPTILEEEAAVLDKNGGINVVYSQAISVQNGKEELRVATPAGTKTVVSRNEFERLLTQGNFVPLLTAMFRRRLYEKLGGWDVNLRFHADHEFWIRLAKSHPFAYLAKPLAYYRVHSQADHLRPEFLSSFESEFSYILAKHLSENQPKLANIRRQAYSYYYQTASATKILEGDLKKAADFWLKSFLKKPFSFNQFVLLISFVWYLIKKNILRTIS